MASFTLAPSSSDEPTAATLCDLGPVALLPLEVREYETQLGERTGLRFHAFDLSGESAVDLGTGVFWQQVLVERLSTMTGRWVVARIIRPAKAYLLAAPSASDLERLEGLMAEVPEPSELVGPETGSDLLDDDGDEVW